ncbi:cystatin-9-like [Pteropus medius]|uniref:cystatin-9-like n=1 Tax=Pteropus vampyrus TaxID=132908 RepID=UPI00196AE064|nr:cystatin-9-like [Pteropus giganteus]
MPLLLIGSQLLATHGWNSQEERENDGQKVMESYFPATLEYALHIYNLKSKDSNAYKLVCVRSSRREQDFLNEERLQNLDDGGKKYPVRQSPTWKMFEKIG